MISNQFHGHISRVGRWNLQGNKRSGTSLVAPNNPSKYGKKEKKRKSEWNLIFFVDTSVEFVWLTIKHGRAMWLICLFRNPQYQLYNKPWNYSSFDHCFIFRKGKANLPTMSCIARSWKDEGLPLDILKNNSLSEQRHSNN